MGTDKGERDEEGEALPRQRCRRLPLILFILFIPVRRIGAARFELAASCSQNKRATKLRHAPPC